MKFTGSVTKLIILLSKPQRSSSDYLHMVVKRFPSGKTDYINAYRNVFPVFKGLSTGKSCHAKRTFLYIDTKYVHTNVDRYLAAFQERTLQVFFTAFEKWELDEVLKDVESTVLSSSQSLPVAHLHPATLFRMISNWTIFWDSRIVLYFATHSLPDHLPGWPQPSMPPGILLFLLAAQNHLRQWAVSHITKNSFVPHELFQGSYLLALEAICDGIQHQLRDSAEGQVTAEHYSFAQSSDFWNGMNTVLRLLPPQWLAGSSGKPVVLRRAIMNHLRFNDSRSYFFIAYSMAMINYRQISYQF